MTTTVRYAALLRGVSPMNAKMPELKRCFESAGFTDVKTVISSGNVVFSAPKAALADLEDRCVAAMAAKLDKPFATIVRPVDALSKLLASDPYQRFKLAANAKRVVTFLRHRGKAKLTLPIEFDGARILAATSSEVFAVYVPSPRGAAFMTLLEKTFGKDITTRTWETIGRIIRAASAA